jgi:hypothetical protein
MEAADHDFGATNQMIPLSLALSRRHFPILPMPRPAIGLDLDR